MRHNYWLLIIGLLIIFGIVFWVYRADAPTETKSDILTETESGLSITSPSGYETWYEGEVYNITWKAPNAIKVNIDAATGGKSLGLIVQEVDADTGSYTWTVPAGYISNFGPDEAEVVIRLFDSSNPDDFHETEPIFIKVK